MTYVWRAGEIPARPLIKLASIRRAPAFACAGVLSAINAQADQITNALTWESPIEAISTLGGIAAVIWIAMYATLKVGFEGSTSRLSARDAIVVAFIVVLSLVPVSYAAQGGLLLSASYLFANSEAGDGGRRASLVLFALTGPLIWGRLLLQLFATRLLWLDAHLAAIFAGSRVQGNTVRFADGGSGFLIASQCSSVHNMSLAIVLWTTAAVVFKLRVDREYVVVGVAMAALMFALNIMRLSLMAVFPSHFDWMHTGLGADLFGWAGLIGAALIAAWGVSSAAQRQR